MCACRLDVPSHQGDFLLEYWLREAMTGSLCRCKAVRKLVAQKAEENQSVHALPLCTSLLLSSLIGS